MWDFWIEEYHLTLGNIANAMVSISKHTQHKLKKPHLFLGKITQICTLKLWNILTNVFSFSQKVLVESFTQKQFRLLEILMTNEIRNNMLNCIFLQNALNVCLCDKCSMCHWASYSRSMIPLITLITTVHGRSLPFNNFVQDSGEITKKARLGMQRSSLFTHKLIYLDSLLYGNCTIKI